MQPAPFDYGQRTDALCTLYLFCLFGLLSQLFPLVVDGRQIVYK